MCCHIFSIEASLHLFNPLGCLAPLLTASTLQVEMERSYLTAEVFREILQQNGRSNENGEVIRTLSGRQVQWHSCLWRWCCTVSRHQLRPSGPKYQFLTSLYSSELLEMPVQVSDVNADERSSPTDKHTQKIAAHVSAYIHHVRTQLKQTIPKAIVHCLVRWLTSLSSCL